MGGATAAEAGSEWDSVALSEVSEIEEVQKDLQKAQFEMAVRLQVRYSHSHPALFITSSFARAARGVLADGMCVSTAGAPRRPPHNIIADNGRHGVHYSVCLCPQHAPGRRGGGRCGRHTNTHPAREVSELSSHCDTKGENLLINATLSVGVPVQVVFQSDSESDKGSDHSK
jgi:hypothetical protein